MTLMNRTGFLCHDRSSCILASEVCDGIRTCPHGEDEDEALCREYLLSPALALDVPSRVLWGLTPNSNYPCGQTEAQPSLKLPGPFMSSGLGLYGSQEYVPTLGNVSLYASPCPENLYSNFMADFNYHLYQEAFLDSQTRLSFLLWAAVVPVLPCIPALVTLVVTLNWHICHSHQTANSSGLLDLGAPGHDTQGYPE